MKPGLVIASTSVGRLVEYQPDWAPDPVPGLVYQERPIVYLHTGHHGRGTGAHGVAGDEWDLCGAYGERLAALLVEAGVCVRYDRRGLGYKTRAAPVVVTAGASPVKLYVQLHMNAGLGAGGQHGLVFNDYRSRRGPLAARIVADHLGASVGYQVRALPSNAGGYGNIHPCIQHIAPVALLVEPGFVERSADVERIAVGLAAGIFAALPSVLDPLPVAVAA